MDNDGLHRFLHSLSGSEAWPPVLVRDQESPIGWRAWAEQDSAALLEWASGELGASGRRGHDRCFNQKELAEYLGVSVPKVQELLRREEHPIPHIKDGRKILAPGFLLEEWLREGSSQR